MEKKYIVEFTEDSKKNLKKLDKYQAKLIKKWIIENLIYTTNPRRNGKALKGTLTGLWRYRVGDYRIICEIQDYKLIIVILEIGHRKEIYKK
ncbi:type II toxin-antitoxin system RelE family toxin [Oceanivirga miroungae]|uniref:RelE/StbE family addiction module toxin n=1 Tax=Oceanivirga miroungae TaxID=1130046 RepID=A0A6I8MEH1_9FUSO|nr:type II toxin-antitoxin system RelE/ParE family toxin [Oceanivirga miroungae]VWL89650.1 RelE/StbE family addiction module toxin [Oceanivirga miroungae]